MVKTRFLFSTQNQTIQLLTSRFSFSFFPPKSKLVLIFFSKYQHNFSTSPALIINEHSPHLWKPEQGHGAYTDATDCVNNRQTVRVSDSDFLIINGFWSPLVPIFFWSCPIFQTSNKSLNQLWICRICTHSLESFGYWSSAYLCTSWKTDTTVQINKIKDLNSFIIYFFIALYPKVSIFIQFKYE